MSNFCFVGLVFVECTGSIRGDQIDLDLLQKQSTQVNASKAFYGPKAVSDVIPQSKDELNSMRTVVTVYKGDLSSTG